MRRVLGCLVAVVLLATGLSGCTAASPVPSSTPTGPTLGNNWQMDHSLALSYATGFQVDFYPGDGPGCASASPDALGQCEAGEYALITILDGSRYLVVPPGRPVPAGLSSGIVVLQQPLTNLYVAASASMSLFAALDELPAVKFTSVAANGWYIPAVKAAMDSGQVQFGGSYSTPDYELLAQSSPALAIENTGINSSPDVKQKLTTLGIPVLVEQSSLETHPLGRNEWIKLIGVLMGKEALAAQLFEAQVSRLNAVPGAATGKTVAYFYVSSKGYVVAPPAGNYVPRMIQLAGASYILSDTDATADGSSVTLEMEQFYATAQAADYIIYNSTIGAELTSLNDLIALNPLLQDFQAVKTGNVWCTDKDFYQDMTGLGQMTTDLHQIVADPAAPDQLTYFHRLR